MIASRSLVAALGIALACAAVPASAATYTIVIAPVDGFDSESFASGSADKLPSSGTFTNDYAFSLSDTRWDFSANIGVTAPHSSWLPTASTWTLFNAITHVAIASASLVGGKASLGEAGDIEIASGDYYLEWTGTSHKALAWSGNITVVDGVPETSTWAMLLAGFGGLALVGYRRAQKAAIG